MGLKGNKYFIFHINREFLLKYSLGLEKPKKASSYESVFTDWLPWEVVNDEHISHAYLLHGHHSM